MFPAYLLLGPENGQKSQEIKNIRQACTAEYGGPPELYRFYPFETEQGEILQVLRNQNLFAEHSLVILSQAETLNAAQVKMITEYLKKPSRSATLIIISAESRVSKKIENCIDRSARKIFWEMFEDRKREWLTRFFREYKLDISDEAVELILELVENNTYDLKAACSQLALYFLGKEHTAPASSPRDFHEISVKEVETYIYHSRRENVFSLFKAIADSNLEQTLEVYRTLLYAGEADPAALLPGLLWQFRRLRSFRELRESGVSEEQAFKGVAVLGKSTPITGKRNQQTYRTAAANYSETDLAAIIIRISACDTMVREYGTSMQQLLIEMMLYDCIVKGGRRASSLRNYCASFSALTEI